MADLRALVSELAKIGDGPPIVTLYLDTHWRDEQQRERVRLFFRERAREARQLFADNPDGAQINATLDRLGEWVEQAVNQEIYPDARGVMLVASEGRGIFIENVLAESIDSAMYVDRRPRLFPLIELLRLERPAFLVAIDSAGAQIYDWRVGEIVDRQGIERDIPNRHSRGGWSQRHFAQHVRHVIEGVWKECSALLEKLCVDSPNADVVLFGQEPNLRGFERLLPPGVVSKIIGMQSLPPDHRKMIEQARRGIDEERVAREFSTVHRILRQGLSDRSGTVGLEETLLAVNERRVRVLALSRRFAQDGLCCKRCDALSLKGNECPFCGGELQPVQLREELCRRCVAEGGEVVVVADGGPLEPYRGIGAMLRHLMGEERAQHPIGRLGGAEASVSP